MKFFLLLLIIFQPVLANAQDSAILRKYEQRTVFLHGGKYMLDGQRLPKSSLKLLLNKYSESRAEYFASRKWATGSNILNTGALALYLAAISQMTRYNTSRFEQLFLASLVTSVISLPIARQGKKHFDKSLWLYNRNAMAF